MDTIADIWATQREWEGRAILLVDLDAFFASVEQLDHPQWRGKPVIVGGKAGKRGVVSTCSYEARAFGVRSAMPSATAQRLCPEAIWSESHFPRYRQLSRAVMGILYDESPLLEQVSIDEAFLDVSPGRFCKESPVEIASRIQRRVSELGITCSIGVATGKSLAKIASDIDKPQGLTVVYPGSEARLLAPLDVRSMPGIGKQTAAKLADIGVKTLGDLAHASKQELAGILGSNAEELIQRASGVDTRPIVTEREVKSVSHERTFTQDLANRSEIEDAVDYLGCLVGRRLRKKGLAGHAVVLKLRYADLSIRTARQTIPCQTDDETVFIPIAKQLISQIWRPGDSVRLVGLGISGFEQSNAQASLFAEDEPGFEGNPDLISAADKVRDRFGDDKLKFGRQLKLRSETSCTPSSNDSES